MTAIPSPSQSQSQSDSQIQIPIPAPSPGPAPAASPEPFAEPSGPPRDAPIYLSVVIPAFNEQERIADSLYRVKEYLRTRPYRSEIIVVDDGSADLTTEVVKTIDIYEQEIHEQEPGELMENLKNVGKGFSIARGLLKARGEIVLFSDADLSTPIEEIEKLLPHFAQGNELVIGSRKAIDAIVAPKPLLRRLMSKVLNLLVQVLAVPGIQDTQCGFKAYRRETAHRLAALQRVYGFAFDMEHLFIARRLGFHIKEVGVRWTHVEGSTVHPVRDSYRMFRDMLKIRFYHRKLRPAKAT
jgi:dolichyl-phosphate beta-glucosyltransferase